ncbi:MAG TPA: thioredoxin family protein [Candidatus Bilamarchaeaceae archaeon]|nr:thioredoxin family protein [Candidatus Bilamarchaeaceae archaeon]
MKIEILGMGCPNCKRLEENARKAVSELGIDAEMVKVAEIEKIMGYDVMSAPALVVDGKVVCSGRVPDVKEIKGWLA